MERASVRPDDIVRLNKKGRAFGAFVLAKGNGALEIEPINRGITYMTASAREVICHWPSAGGREPGQRLGAAPPRVSANPS